MSDYKEIVFSPITDIDTSSNHRITRSISYQDELVRSNTNANTKNETNSNNYIHNSIKHVDNINEHITIIDEDNIGTSTIYGASFNFINSIVGAGIIGIPYAIQECGLLLGIFLLLFVSYLVYCSVIMLIDCGIKCCKYNFETLSEYLLGRYGYYIVLIFMFLFAYGAQIAYLIIIGDTIPLVSKLFFPNSFLCNRQSTLLFISILIILPICLLRNLTALSYTSFLSIIADIVIVIIVLVNCKNGYNTQDEHFEENNLDLKLHASIFAGIGISIA